MYFTASVIATTNKIASNNSTIHNTPSLKGVAQPPAVCGSAVFMIQYSTFSVNLFLMLDDGDDACYNIHKEALPADGSPPFKEKTMTVILC